MSAVTGSHSSLPTEMDLVTVQCPVPEETAPFGGITPDMLSVIPSAL